MPYRCPVIPSWMAFMSSKRCPSSVSLSLGNKIVPWCQIGGVGRVHDCCNRYLRQKTLLVEGGVRRGIFLQQPAFCVEQVASHPMHSLVLTLHDIWTVVTVVSWGKNALWIITLMSKKTISIIWTRDFWSGIFFCVGDFFDRHFMLLSFHLRVILNSTSSHRPPRFTSKCKGSLQQIQYNEIATTVYSFCFWSGVKQSGTKRQPFFITAEHISDHTGCDYSAFV
jgi:hypothetical protein